MTTRLPPAGSGSIPARAPQQQVLEIRVEGLSVEADPDRTTIREVTNTLFELASDDNIATFDAAVPPLFTQRVVLVDSDGRLFFAIMGAAVGDVELFRQQQRNSRRVAPK